MEESKKQNKHKNSGEEKARKYDREPLTIESVSDLERKVIGVIGTDYIEGNASVKENIPLNEVGTNDIYYVCYL